MNKAILKPGSILFVRWYNNPISNLIAWFMKSEWSHCAYVLGECNGITKLAETTDFEVTNTSFNKYNNVNCSLEVWEPIEEVDTKKMCQELTKIEGTLYGYLQLLSLGLRRLLFRIGIKIPNLIRQGSVCTAVPIFAYQTQKHIRCISSLDPESIDTQELYEIIQKNQEFKCTYVKFKGELWEDCF